MPQGISFRVSTLTPEEQASLSGPPPPPLSLRTSRMTPEELTLGQPGTEGLRAPAPPARPKSPEFGTSPIPTDVRGEAPLPTTPMTSRFGNLPGRTDTGVGTRPPAYPSDVTKGVRAAAPAAGSIIGSAIGAPLGPAGSASGAVLGASGGEALAIHLSDEPVSFDEARTRIGRAGASGLIGEGAGGLTSAAVNKGAAPFAKSVTPEGLQASERLGGVLRPDAVAESPFLTTLMNVAEGSPFGRGRMLELAKQTDAKLAKEVEALKAEFGAAAGPEATGQSWQKFQSLAHRAAKDDASSLYDDVDALAGDTKVSLEPLLTFVQEEAARRGQLSTALTGGQTASTLKKVEQGAQAGDDLSAAKEAAELLAGADPGNHNALLAAFQDAGVDPTAIAARQVSFRQGHQIRSSLGQLIRDANRRGDGQLRGIATQLRDRIDTAMTEGAQATPDLRQRYDEATAAWKDMATGYEKGLLAKVAKADPHMVARMLIQPRMVKPIEEARQRVGDVAWKEVLASDAEELLKGTGGPDSVVTGRQLTTRLARRTPETMNAAYPRGTSSGFYQLGRILTQVEKARGGQGKMWIQLATPGAVGTAAGVLTGNVGKGVAAASAVLLVPHWLSRIVLHPKGREWLTTGLAAPGTAKGARAAAQLLAFLVSQGLIQQSGPPARPTLTTGGGRQGGPGALASQGPPPRP